jgi:hypothetical protein
LGFNAGDVEGDLVGAGHRSFASFFIAPPASVLT